MGTGTFPCDLISESINTKYLIENNSAVVIRVFIEVEIDASVVS